MDYFLIHKKILKIQLTFSLEIISMPLRNAKQKQLIKLFHALLSTIFPQIN